MKDLSRSEVIELLCNVILDDSNQKQVADNILANLIRNAITVDQAYQEYQDLLRSNSKYWIDKIKPKAVYEALKKYEKGDLDRLSTSKMISSLITHAIIELQSNPNVSINNLGITDLSNILNASFSDIADEDFYKELDEVLFKYGYLDRKEGE